MKRIGKLITLFLLIVITLLACEEEESMSMEAYASLYYELFESMSNHLNGKLMSEATDMITLDTYDVSYSHEDFLHYCNQVISELDQLLYQLDRVGPQLEDPILRRYQSKLEYALFDLFNILTDAQDTEMFNTLYPNQFTLYDDLYQLTYQMNDRLLDTFAFKAEIDHRLLELGYPARPGYYEDHVRFILSYTYFESVIAAQVSTYQDYSGLQLNPRNPNILETSDGKWYKVYESAYSVMLPQLEVLRSVNGLLSNYYDSFDLDPELYKAHHDIFDTYIQAYVDYVSVRAMYPYEYYKRGDYKPYMTQVGSFIARTWWESNHPIYDFDPAYNETHYFDIMQKNFDTLFNLINNNHDKYIIHD